MNRRLSIVLPCYNEAATLEPLLQQFARLYLRREFELILVDNGSTDDTQDVLGRLLSLSENSFARAVRIENNLGYGHGIMTGLKAAKGDILAFSHADRQTPPEDILRAGQQYERLLASTPLCLVRGVRPGRDKVLLTTRFLSEIQSFLTGFYAEDVNGQPKVFGRELLERMSPSVSGFSFDAQILYEAAKAGFVIETVEVQFLPRKYGISKSAGTILRKYKTIWSFIRDLIAMAWRDRDRGGSIFYDFNKHICREWVACSAALFAVWLFQVQSQLNFTVTVAVAFGMHAATHTALSRFFFKPATDSLTLPYVQSLRLLAARILIQLLCLVGLVPSGGVPSVEDLGVSFVLGFVMHFVSSRINTARSLRGRCQQA